MTPERFERIHQVLAQRQPDLTVCMEQVHKPNNISAIIRTADAVGVHRLHAVWPKGSKMRALGGTSAGSRNWVDVQTHDSTAEAFDALHAQGMQILVTNLSDTAIDFRDVDYTRPTAIVLGQEKEGISREALDKADQDILIPMVGMVQSLNVSVASALILYEAQRQRQLAGMYQRAHTRIPDEEVHKILFERGHPVLARVAKQKGLPYPPLDEHGQIVADEAWWSAMQAAKHKRSK
ncbi:tRNA (guanosine(18)-2'-O)-methyltransferase TrmH [Salinivibrio proteolyticus]|uniref:tRNA (guanosine(18)-2'-O)-methyltransferase TrmH n=1 Tax=Salinivibrio TaxID=51366 RepID=UPI000988FF0E|nr:MULTISPECIES: tRNA (guanosine(18)-2'-O)-methyltransferase TrmH [Salinivibrio]OOF11829.1 tRNA (guanosine(18)-2'-O)-methyltransferase TrmH [Salinivibrio sp. PR5]OOF23414.1 tRNA (guanosine(18)-2'-O)-methyltransferase TrmH [Salinivibrio sp. IB574]OOF27153.1 tRNA (guanosine(18)-2'-O)-methyltransferase TrmH [Salinivibrio proteolyticus]PCE68552.1 tRNA (guanosine(18)-2'-O)-methyltransferase TrmH [Salinivibrio sp. YCSC6]QCF37010.1 tRNA (guanosine(18)-2'-O)-methyltransferase TrmH [Salinivibrio sp. YC